MAALTQQQQTAIFALVVIDSGSLLDFIQTKEDNSQVNNEKENELLIVLHIMK